MINVLLVDDQPRVRAGLRMRLGMEPDITIVGEAASGQAALALAEQLQPDVVVMDSEMPDLDGIATTRILLTRCPVCGVVVLTLYCDRLTREQALGAGALAVVEKLGTEFGLVSAIRRAAASSA